MVDNETLEPDALAEDAAEPEKRNCGRSGPTSPGGRAASSKNAIKHGACARTLILDRESEEAWELLLARWCKTYQPAEDSLEYDFVLKVAQAEWHRIRTQLNFDACMCQTLGRSSYTWSPEEIKHHDLALRYKTAAERAFQREYRLLEQHLKTHRPAKTTASPRTAAKEAKEKDPADSPFLDIIGVDPASPTGYRLLERCFGPPGSAAESAAKRGTPYAYTPPPRR